MPIFKFTALHLDGKTSSAVVEADSMQSAKEKLQLQQMIITHLQEIQQAPGKNRLKKHDFLQIIKMLSQLYEAGIPLYESISIVAKRYENMPFHPFLLTVGQSLQKGDLLSQALEKFPHFIDPIFIALIASGEKSGQLTTSFLQIIAILEEKKRVQKQLIKALSYPIFLAIFCVLLFFALLIWLIPSLKHLSEGSSVNALTRFVFSLSDLFLLYYPYFLFLLGLVITALIYGVKKKSARLKFDQMALDFPVIGSLILLSCTVRFCKITSILLTGTVPLVDALQLSKAALGNQFLSAKLSDTISKIIEGNPLSDHVKWMPPIISKLLAIGEKTGNISGMLHHAALLCEEQVQDTLSKIIAFIQPVCLLALGVMIGFIVLSVLIPLTDIGGLLQS